MDTADPILVAACLRVHSDNLLWITDGDQTIAVLYCGSCHITHDVITYEELEKLLASPLN